MNPLSYFGRYVLFLPWRLHLLIVIVLLFWRKDHTGAVSWLGGAIVLRIIVLYFWACWWLVRSFVTLNWRAWRRFYHFLFSFLPLETSPPPAVPVAPALAAERHALTKRIVMLEGLICAGKTTVALHLARCPLVVVKEEAVPDAVLRRFNESHEGTEIQMVMGARRRVHAAESAALITMSPCGVVHDRSLVGCRAFALWNYVQGSLSRAALDAYMALAGRKISDDFGGIRAPITLLYMPLPVSEALARLRRRAGPDQGTTEQYMLGVSLMHALVIRALLRVPALDVTVQLYSSHGTQEEEDASQRRGEAAVCACQHLKRAGTRAAEIRGLAELRNYDGTLHLNADDGAAERLAEVVDELGLPRDKLGMCVERRWTAELFKCVESPRVSVGAPRLIGHSRPRDEDEVMPDAYAGLSYHKGRR